MSSGQIVAAVVAALAVALLAWRRGRLGLEKGGLVALLAVGCVVYATGILSDLPDPEKAIEDVATALGGWSYLLVGAMAFLETGAGIGLVAPGEFTVIFGGVIAGQGEISIVLLIGIVWACAVAGDTVSFFIGRKLGRAFLMRHGPKVKISEERLAQVEKYFDRHGGKTILIGRFIGLVRALAPFVAGASGMRYTRFIPFSIVGTGLWSTTFCMLGYVFYRSFERVANIAGRATLAFGIVVALIVAIVWTYRRLREEENRRRLAAWFERQGQKPLLKPLAFVIRPVWRFFVRPFVRVLMPQLRFLWGRLTPGGLGLELTTSLAVAGTGLYVFSVYALLLRDDSGPTTGDQTVADVINDVRADQVADVAKVVTELGSFPVVFALVLIGSVLLAWRRRPAEILVLLGGFAVLFAAVQLSKAGIDRPRPPEPLASVNTPSYPSGHAAYATTYVTLAVIASRVLPNLVSRAALVVASIVAAAAIGGTRLYLGVHWFSDVAGGFGLGFGMYGGLGSLALLVSYIRQNQPESAVPERAG